MEQAIKGFIQRDLMRNNGKDTLEITDNLIERGIIDSLGIVKLLAYLEKKFDIHIGDDELLPANFETVETLAEFVRSKQNKTARKDLEPKDVYYVQQRL